MYFGQNQVQYDQFDWQVIETDHFLVHYYPEIEEVAQDAARMSERSYARLSRLMAHEFAEKKPILLYGSSADFAQSNVFGDLGEGTGGVTDFLRQRMAQFFTGDMASFEHVFQHEMVHVVPVRHLLARPGRRQHRRARAGAAAAVDDGGDGRVLLHRAVPPVDERVGARRRAQQHAPDHRADDGAPRQVLPVPLRAVGVAVRRRAVGRRRDRRDHERHPERGHRPRVPPRDGHGARRDSARSGRRR